MLVFIGACLALILLLAIPVNLVYAVKKKEVWQGRVIVYWMFGLLRVRLRPRQKRAARQSGRRRERRRLIPSGIRQIVQRRRDVLSILRTSGLLRGLFRLLRDLLRAARPRRLRVEFAIGLEDPADTGRLAAVLAPLSLLFGKRTLVKGSNVSIEVTPDFVGSRFQGYSCASLQFVPLRLFAILIGFLFSAPVFRAVRQMMARAQ